MSYLLLMALFVLPIGVRWYVQGVAQERGVTPEQLATLTITSPYAAAASVPMHTYDSSGRWGGGRIDIIIPPLAVFPGGWDAPVWLVYLVVCPVLGLLFSVVAWLAFRWRWWRAGAGL